MPSVFIKLRTSHRIEYDARTSSTKHKIARTKQTHNNMMILWCSRDKHKIRTAEASLFRNIVEILIYIYTQKGCSTVSRFLPSSGLLCAKGQSKVDCMSGSDIILPLPPSSSSSLLYHHFFLPLIFLLTYCWCCYVSFDDDNIWERFSAGLSKSEICRWQKFRRNIISTFLNVWTPLLISERYCTRDVMMMVPYFADDRWTTVSRLSYYFFTSHSLYIYVI